VGADRAGTIGWQVVGDVPRREVGAGLLPRQAPGRVTAGREDWRPTTFPGSPIPRRAGSPPRTTSARRDGEGPWLGSRLDGRLPRAADRRGAGGTRGLGPGHGARPPARRPVARMARRPGVRARGALARIRRYAGPSTSCMGGTAR
jgi:hypothetical protein